MNRLPQLWSHSESGQARAVSEVVGVVLLIAIVFLGVGALVGFGVTGITDETERVEEVTVEEDLSRLHTAIEQQRQSLTAQGGDTVSFGLGEVNANAGYETRGQSATVQLETGNYTAGSFAPTQTVVEQSVSALSFESQATEARLRYELGAVITSPSSTAQGNIIRNPAVAYATRPVPGNRSRTVTTLSVPLVSVTANTRLRDAAQLRTGPTASLKITTVESHALRLTLTTPFPSAWEQLYRDRLPATAIGELTTTDSQLTLVIVRGEPCSSSPCDTAHTFIDVSYQEIQLTPPR